MIATAAAASTHLAVEARDLWFSYGSGRTVLRGVSFAAPAAQVTMIIGASGGGKTTLLKLCKGLLTPERGDLTVLGQAFGKGQPRLDARVAYIPQQLGLVRNLTVLDNVLTGALGRVNTLASLLGIFPRHITAQAYSILDQLGIRDKAGDRVMHLSGGERQRVAIARALMQEPQVVLADEFISQLDPVTSDEIMGIMREIAGQGVALVMTTHEMDIVTRYADRVIVLRDGEKVLDGPGYVLDTSALGLAMKQRPEQAVSR